MENQVEDNMQIIEGDVFHLLDISYNAVCGVKDYDAGVGVVLWPLIEKKDRCPDCEAKATPEKLNAMSAAADEAARMMGLDMMAMQGTGIRPVTLLDEELNKINLDDLGEEEP